MIEVRLIAATYLGHGRCRWLVRVPTFPTVYDLRLRLHAEQCLAIGLLGDVNTASDLARARSDWYATIEAHLARLPEDAPLDVAE